MEWVIESVHDCSRPFRKPFVSAKAAEKMIERFAPHTSEHYRVVPADLSRISDTGVRMLREGMVKGDLRGILLPKVSVDQYLPADPKSTNVVIAWFIKGVPEAVLPVKNYIDHCDGVIDVDYGDSETIPNCSIVYAEMQRDKLNTDHIHSMVRQMARLAGIDAEDFTLTFPNTDDKFPYKPEVLDQYFQLRTEEDNQRAQEQALSVQQQQDDDTNHQEGVEPNKGQTQIAQEAMINRMVGLFN